MESIVENSGIYALRAKYGQNIFLPLTFQNLYICLAICDTYSYSINCCIFFFYFPWPKLGVRLRLPPSQFGLRGSVRHSALPPAAGAEEGKTAQAIRGRQEGGDKVIT